MKKFIFAIILLSCFCLAFTERFDSFEYEIIDGGITITKYLGYEKNVVIQDTIAGLPVTAIGKYAFWENKSLQAISIPDSVTIIGNSAFEDCENLKVINIPNSCISIGKKAFKDCEKIKNITIPNSCTSIGSEAFEDCELLEIVYIPNSVTSIGKEAFDDCKSLKYIELEDEHGEPFRYCKANWLPYRV